MTSPVQVPVTHVFLLDGGDIKRNAGVFKQGRSTHLIGDLLPAIPTDEYLHEFCHSTLYMFPSRSKSIRTLHF